MLEIQRFLKETQSARIMVEDRWLVWALNKWVVFQPGINVKRAVAIGTSDNFDDALLWLSITPVKQMRLISE